MGAGARCVRNRRKLLLDVKELMIPADQIEKDLLLSAIWPLFQIVRECLAQLVGIEDGLVGEGFPEGFTQIPC